MIIHKSLIPDTGYEMLGRLLASLPNVFTIEQYEVDDGQPEKFKVSMGNDEVATVTFNGSFLDFYFEVGQRGEYLRSLLSKQYFADLLWLVVVPSYEKKYTYYDRPTTSQKDALGVVGANVWREGTYLIGFSSKAWEAGVNSVEYLLSFKLLPHGDALVPGMENQGSGTIQFTTLERA